MSLGLLFDSVAHTATAFELYRDELLSDHGYAATVTVEGGLGDEGLCAEFDNPSLGGIHEDACLWRNGSLVLIAGGTLQPEAILLLAHAVDQRATGAAGH